VYFSAFDSRLATMRPSASRSENTISGGANTRSATPLAAAWSSKLRAVSCSRWCSGSSRMLIGYWRASSRERSSAELISPAICATWSSSTLWIVRAWGSASTR